MLLCYGSFVFFLAVASASDVLEYTDSNFDSEIKDKEIALVEFFAPWCGHCKRLAPEYETAATKLKKNDPPVPLIKVDCTEGGKETCGKHGVSGYPTLKIFKNGKMTQDYEGPRQADGIVGYMKKHSGPASKEYKDLDKLQNRLADAEDNLIVGFFSEEDNTMHKRFAKAADNKRNDFDFAHTFAPEILKHYNYENAIVIFRPSHLHAKFEDPFVAITDPEESVLNIERFIDDNQFGMVGQVRGNNEAKFMKPVIIAYYNVDWRRNKKGTQYWRNRVARIAKKFKGKPISFAIANKGEYTRQIDDWKLDQTQDVLVAAKNAQGEVFLLKDEPFSVANLEKFVNDFVDGKLKPYIKSEPIPENNDGPVKVVVGETFKDIVLDETKDVLIEMYAPWCGHCKSLEPKYNELGEKMKDVKDIVIAKMDATANSSPPNFSVGGFPTIFWAPMGKKANPQKYQGGREVSDFIDFLKRESTNPFEITEKKKKKKKDSKEEL
ncbi:protein disulfide-isomerase A3-like [Rhopilema esculentum]|uniref:protein disulfide-isomerase A3-like n=1 Tax=Rhopilema esculentum TaxID=499914 RepID=UPI0031E1C2CF|eukprot:gene6465-11915_t